MSDFNLNDLFKQAFGYDAPKDKFEFPKASDRVETSSLGQPYYATDLSGREFFLPITLNKYLVPFAVIGMTWRKTYVSTSLPERGGSVRELISIDDFLFNIKGIIINDENVFPESDLRDIYSIFKINESIELRSVISDVVLSGKSDIAKDDTIGHRVIIKEIKWPAVSGVEHAKPFEMELESDMIFELELA